MLNPLLTRAGLSPEVLSEIDRLMVGCGGFVRELVAYTAGESTVKDVLSGQRLSAADTLVDRLLRQELLRLVPGSSGYSEEGGAFGERKTGGMHVRWSLDPVDGTRSATLGGVFAVCAGALVLEENQPAAALGWVYVPTLSLLFRGILAPGLQECLLNDSPARVETGLTEPDLPNRYLAVASNWRTERLPRAPMKLSAPGATAVHLVQLVQPGSDVVAAGVTRYKPYDAAAALVVAAAGGGRIFRLTDSGLAPVPEDTPRFLGALDAEPERDGPPVLVCTPEVAALVR